MDYRLPYYMAYPMPFQYDDEKIERRDYDYMKSLYPDAAKRMLPYVEEECERMEYEGSMMYDEYPDQLQLRVMCGRIYNRVTDMERLENKAGYMQELEGQNYGNRRGNDEWVRDMITVMVFQELHKRRCDHRRCRSRFY